MVKGLKACFGRSGALQGWSKARRASRTLCTTRMAHGKEGPTSWEGKHESNGYSVRRPFPTLGIHAWCVAPVRPRLLKRPPPLSPSFPTPNNLVLQMRHLLFWRILVSYFSLPLCFCVCSSCFPVSLASQSVISVPLPFLLFLPKTTSLRG